LIGGIYAAGLAIEVMGKLLLYHPAPPHMFYRGMGLLFPSGFVHTNYSYPSGHVYRFTFIIVLLLLFLAKRNTLVYKIAFIGILGLMLVSRVYLGEHWLTDVIGGGLLGTGLAFGVWRYLHLKPE
jgi:membrane-associated phospholipid phosphatase